MDQSESKTHAFIVRIRMEQTIEESGRALWHGRIIHVPSGEQSSIRDLHEIPLFIVPYLEQMGIRVGVYWRTRRWLGRRRRGTMARSQGVEGTEL
jgi:hypothetical protein